MKDEPPKIFGQDDVKQKLSRVFEIFTASAGQIRPHFILTGPSGCGKSMLINSLATANDLDYIGVNAAQLTKEGTAGNSLSKALASLRMQQGSPTVVFVDEFDKLFISGNDSTLAHEITVGVQNEFLHVLESGVASVFGDYGKFIEVDMTKVLFVFAGAFNNAMNINIDDLRSYGLKTEFLGRVGLIYSLRELDLEDLVNILRNSPLLQQYIQLFPEVSLEQAVNVITAFLRDNYAKNTIGARMVNTLIHRFFVHGGSLTDQEVSTVTFQTQLKF